MDMEVCFRYCDDIDFRNRNGLRAEEIAQCYGHTVIVRLVIVERLRRVRASFPSDQLVNHLQRLPVELIELLVLYMVR